MTSVNKLYSYVSIDTKVKDSQIGTKHGRLEWMKMIPYATKQDK